MGDAGHDAEIVGDEQQAEAEVALQLGQQAQDLRLHRDVERRGRLVGDQELRLAHQRHGDHHALAQAARELVRELAEAQAGCGDADAAQKIGGAVDGDPLAHLLVPAHHLGHLRTDRVGRIEAGHRLLEDHRHGIAAQARHAAIVELQQVLALEAERCAVRWPPRASRFITAKAVTDLPQPDSPTRQWVSPRSTVSEAPRTAEVLPPKPTSSFSTSSSALMSGT